MRIAFIGQKGIPASAGGVETHVEKLAVGLAARGHRVFVYARPWYSPKKRSRYRGVDIIYRGSIKTKNFDTITHVFLATLDALGRDFDIIHYHGVGPALLAWLPKFFKPHCRVIVTFHSVDRKHLKWGVLARFFLKLGEWFAVHFADETITVSKSLQDYCRVNYGTRTIYIPNGVDLTERTRASLIKKKFNLSAGKYILFLSRLVRHKGAGYLIRAFNQIPTDYKLVIAGGGAFTDEYVSEIQTLARVNKNIILTGSLDAGGDLWRELYSNAYLFVLPSEAEGLPIVVLEAMSFGRCVLVSDIPENREAIANGFGFKFKNKNIRDLKNKLEYLLARPKLVSAVGAAGREHVRLNYSWNEIVPAIEAVYQAARQNKKMSRVAQTALLTRGIKADGRI
jgi:glycosyltransferase involved in cell wall biosynthesis